MKLERWLFGALTVAGLVYGACGDDPGYEGGPGNPSTADDDDDDDDAPTTRRDAGMSSRDGSGPKAPIATGDDDSDDDGDDDEDESTCDSVSIQAKPNAPEILIVLDRSGSMIGAGAPQGVTVNRWDPSASAVKKLTSELNEVVNFGLMLFPAPAGAAMPPPAMGGGQMGGGFLGGLLGGGMPGGGFPGANSCAAGKVDVPVKTMSAADIAKAIDSGRPDQFAMTPTAVTLEAAATAIKGEMCADCREAPKYVLLVTDGQPTCGMGDPTMPGAIDPAQVEATNVAIDKLKAAGVGTYVVGYDTRTDPALATTMDTFAMRGGTGTHLAVENEAELIDKLRAIAGGLISCEFELNDEVENPALVRVVIDGEELVLNEGWTIEGKKITLSDDGACPRIKDGRVHTVKIRKECEEQIFR